MEYIVRVIGVGTDFAKLFYISDSLQCWLTTRRANAAVYYSIDGVKSAISQGIEIIKRELEQFYHCKLEGIQVIKRVVNEEVIQTLKPSDI